MRFRKFLKPYKTRGSSFREHTLYIGGAKVKKSYLGLLMMFLLLGRKPYGWIRDTEK